jgi:hypothetical protein
VNIVAASAEVIEVHSERRDSDVICNQTERWEDAANRWRDVFERLTISRENLERWLVNNALGISIDLNYGELDY